MRTYFPAVLLLLAAVYLSVTGFQCGSTEMTTAKLAVSQKQYDKAEEALVRGLAKNDKDEEAWFLLGEVRYELKKYREMNEAFSRALALSDLHKNEIDRYRLDVWSKQFNAGVEAYNAGASNPIKYDEAAQSMELAIAILPDSVSTYRALALAYFAKKDNARAIEALENGLERNASYGDGIKLLGQIHYSAGDERAVAGDQAGAIASYAKSAEAYEKLYALDPKNPENIQVLITALVKSKQDDKVLSLTQGCIKEDPNNRVCRFAYGVYLLQRNNYAEAVQHLQKVRDIDPSNSDQMFQDATYNLGVGYLNWGVAMKSEAEKKAEAESKGKRGSDVKVDTSYREKFKSALPYLEETVKVRSDDADLWQRLGQLYANLNMVGKSKESFDRFDRLTKPK